MRVAAIQMIATDDVNANLAEAGVLLREASIRGVELAVLPEYFCLIGHKDTDKLTIAEDTGKGIIQQYLANLSRELKMWIVGGTIPLKTADVTRVRNSVLVFNPAGECISRYDKIHLFRFENQNEHYDESNVLERGDTVTSFKLPSKDGHVWTIGLSVCYDVRFPELYRGQLVDVWLVPSAFTYTTGKAHWEILLRARAIENLSFVIAAAQGGTHPSGRQTWGHSMVIEPWGDVMALQSEGQGVVVADLDAKHLQLVRHQLQALQHKVLN